MFEHEQAITPLLWFDDNAETAVTFYTSIFKNSKVNVVHRYGEAGPGAVGAVMMIEFRLEGQHFLAFNGGGVAKDSQSSGISLFVSCETQADLDRLWIKLSDGGSTGVCGWLTDQFGFAWNLVPKEFLAYLREPDSAKRERVMKAMMQMKKLDIAEIRRAADAG